MKTQKTVGFVFDDRYLQHNPGTEMFWTERGPIPAPFVEPNLHPSSYRLVMRTKQLLDLSGLSEHLQRIEPKLAEPDDLASFHSPDYIAKVRELSSSGGGYAGDAAPVGFGSYQIACLSVGGAIAAVDAVLTGRVRHAFVNARPPGHHALADRGMGYCLFNNVVIAARHAQRVHGLQRVLVLDWDVHHGNGTQAAFYADPSVLFISIHQDGLYPDEGGDYHESGEGAGLGSTVNVPLPAGCGDAVYDLVMRTTVEPVVRSFRPELILVSAGQDGSLMDPEGRMSLTTDGYRLLGRTVVDLANELCNGRLVLLQEGGYSELYAPYCTVAIIEALLGIRSRLPEPEDPAVLGRRPDVACIGASARSALDAIVRHHARHWPVLNAS